MRLKNRLYAMVNMAMYDFHGVLATPASERSHRASHHRTAPTPYRTRNGRSRIRGGGEEGAAGWARGPPPLRLHAWRAEKAVLKL